MKKWQRFRYMPMLPLGQDGRMVTGSVAHIALSRQAAEEGMVLLKNDANILPLNKASKVALFGKASVDYVMGGGGSGGVVTAYIRNLCDSVEEKQREGKLTAYSPLHDFYRAYISMCTATGKEPGTVKEPTLPEQLLAAAAENADIAIISVCRYSGEGSDRNAEKQGGDYYLSADEERLIDVVSSCFHSIVIVLNVGGIVDTSWLATNPKIKAVLLAWQGGQEGAMAEADILCGRPQKILCNRQSMTV